MSVCERVRQCVAEAYNEPLEQITAETRFADLDDSLSGVELVMALEDEFDIDLPLSDKEIYPLLDQLETVGQLAEWIEQHL